MASIASLRKLALTIALAATVVGCELLARLLFDARGFPTRADERAALLRSIPLGDEGDDADLRAAAAVEKATAAPFTLHPYLGYTYRPRVGGASAEGFFAGVPALPYRASGDELVIGLFGGSVAMQLAESGARMVDVLLPAARALGYARVTVLSFAIGGWRQPQHFNAMVRFLDSVDVVVLVDGFNEVIHLGDWHLAHRPAEYPWIDVYDALARQPSRREIVLRAELLEEHAAAARVTRVFQRPVLRSSALAHLVWRVLVARHERAVARLRSEVAESAPRRTDPTIDGPAAITARREDYFRWWHELLAFSNAITRARGKPFFHFVQPNQYVRGAKPLSREEHESFTRHTEWFDEVTPRYATVAAMTARLRDEGVDSTFLGDLFANTRETVYVDDCCHLNARGVELLATAVARHVAASGRIVARDGTMPRG